MEEAFDIPPMDLKASAEQEVRKLQDMVKRLEKQNEILRSSSSQNGGRINSVTERDSVELEEVSLINLNDSSDELEDSWLYESPVKPASPAQKSVNSVKWSKKSSVDGLDDVKGNLFDKLDDIETQQDISKVRIPQTQQGRVPLVNKPKDSLFFQPTNRTIASQGNVDSQRHFDQNLIINDNMHENNQLDSSAYGSMDEMDDMPSGPILRRSAFGKDSPTKSNIPQNIRPFQSEDVDEEQQGPILRRSALAKGSSDLNQNTSVLQFEDIEEPQGPILRRSAQDKSNSKNNPPEVFESDDIDDEMQGPIVRRSAAGSAKAEQQQPSPILRRSAVPKDTRTSPQLNGSPESPSLAVNMSPGSRMQPRARRKQLTDNNGTVNVDNSSQSSQDDLDTDDTNDKGPIARRSALALPKPSSEGLSKQLWYSGPISQMNKQKSKPDSTVARRSVSPSPDRRNKLQPRTPGTIANVTPRRSGGSRGSMEDLLDADEGAPIQRRSLPQVPADSGIKSRAAKSDEGITNRSQLKPKSKIQNLQQPQGNVVARRSKLTAPSSNSSKGVVARRKAPSPNPNDSNLNDSWKDGCY